MSGLDKSGHTFYNGRVPVRKGLVDKKLDYSLRLGFDWLGIDCIRIATKGRDFSLTRNVSFNWFKIVDED